jgi:YHS domain-containing protein
MKCRWTFTVALATVLAWAGTYGLAQQEHGGMHGKMAHAQTKGSQEPTARPAQPLCPVMGGPVDFSVRTMTKDGPVYFCCPDCIAKFEKDPAKYADKVAAQRQTLEKMERVQVTCPVTGNPIDGKTFLMSGGRGINFCCKNCPAKYEQNPAQYKAQLEAAYTYQTRCPVSDEKIDPTAYVDLATGQRIYLCCQGCGEKLGKDPAKYAPSLAKQGIRLDLNKLKPSSEKKVAEQASDHGERAGHDQH